MQRRKETRIAQEEFPGNLPTPNCSGSIPYHLLVLVIMTWEEMVGVCFTGE